MRTFAHFLIGALAFGGVTGMPARVGAEELATRDDFSFRRVVAPPKGQGPRISVQIDPAEQAAWIAAAPDTRDHAGTGAAIEAGETDDAADTDPDKPARPDVPKLSGWEWFWTSVSPETSSGGPANFARAIAALNDKRDAPAPRLQSLQDITRAHGADILMATIGTDVSPALVLALISIESSGKTDAESHAGAQGLMQLIPATAARFGVTDSTDPAQNIKGGVAYLAWLMEQFDRDPILALAGYNAGENAVKEHGGVPPYAETRAYVPKVLNAWRVARGMCMTPPELITDGCVFAGQG